MKKHSSADETRKNLDILLARINALEVGTSDRGQKGMLGVLRVLVDAQIHSVNEFEHLKKAIDLLTLELFDVKNRTASVAHKD